MTNLFNSFSRKPQPYLLSFAGFMLVVLIVFVPEGGV